MITYVKLTPDMADEYVSFFDATPHDDGVDEHKCYCVCWASESCDGVDDSSAQGRRALAERYVKSGAIQGFLARDGGKTVGWCNANTKAECYDSRCGRMYLKPTDEVVKPDGSKVKSVFCFVVAPEYRRRGIAAGLLDAVCRDAAAEGFDSVEAYPMKEFNSERFDYMGPSKMYEKAGFEVIFDFGDRLVVRKTLE